MAVVSYLPASVVSTIHKFATYTAGSEGAGLVTLGTDLTTAFGATAGSIQVTADTTAGQTSNALVIVNDNVVFSVVDGNKVCYFNGKWIQLSPSQLTAQYLQYFTA